MFQYNDRIVFCGIGKSGHLCNLFNASLQSIGFQSAVLCPVDALHGDIGVFKNKFSLFILSKSGESEELYRLCMHIKEFHDIKVNLVTMNDSSSLSSISDNVILINKTHDGNDYGLPSNSIVEYTKWFYTSFNDILKNLDNPRSIIGYSHPNGVIGLNYKTLSSLNVKLLDSNYIFTNDLTVDSIVFKISENKTGQLYIVDQNFNLLNVVTDGDLRRIGLNSKLIEFCITTRNFLSTSKSNTFYEVVNIMKDNNIYHLPVIDGKKLVNIVSISDLLS